MTISITGHSTFSLPIVRLYLRCCSSPSTNTWVPFECPQCKRRRQFLRVRGYSDYSKLSPSRVVTNAYLLPTFGADQLVERPDNHAAAAGVKHSYEVLDTRRGLVPILGFERLGYWLLSGHEFIVRPYQSPAVAGFGF